MVSSLNILSKVYTVLFPLYSCVSKITTLVLRVLIQWKDCKGRHIEVDALRWAWFRSRMRGGFCKPHIPQILKVSPPRRSCSFLWDLWPHGPIYWRDHGVFFCGTVRKGRLRATEAGNALKRISWGNRSLSNCATNASIQYFIAQKNISEHSIP